MTNLARESDVQVTGPLAPPTRPPGVGRVGALDAVRGVAILAVIASHALSASIGMTGSYSVPPPIFKAMSFGAFGVQTFFVLSGWLIFSLYRDRPSFVPRVYWSRRIARIWPLWAVFVVLSFIAYNLPDSGYPWPASLLVSLLFLGWLSPALVAIPLGGLTIQQEVAHYALFALLRRGGAAFLAATVVVGYLSSYVARAALTVLDPASPIAFPLEAWLRLAVFSSWPFFLLGGAAFVVAQSWRRGGPGQVMPGGVAAPAWILGAFVLGMLSLYSQDDIPGYFVLGYVVLSIGIALAANGLAVLGPALRSIGRYSYFMYFFHFWVLRFLEARYHDAGWPDGDTTGPGYNTALAIGSWAIAGAVSWAVGWVSWRVLEKPILNVVHRRIRKDPASGPE